MSYMNNYIILKINQFNNTIGAYKLTNLNIRLKLLSIALQHLPQFNQ